MAALAPKPAHFPYHNSISANHLQLKDLSETHLGVVQSWKPKGKGGGSGAMHSPAAELEEELLQSAPKGNQDKLRVLRSRLKRLSSNLPDRSMGSAGSKQIPQGAGQGASEESQSQQVGGVS